MTLRLSSPTEDLASGLSARLTPEVIEELAQCLIEGKTRRSIADRFGVSVRTVSRWNGGSREGPPASSGIARRFARQDGASMPCSTTSGAGARSGTCCKITTLHLNSRTTLDYHRRSAHHFITMHTTPTDHRYASAVLAAGVVVSGLSTKKRYLR